MARTGPCSPWINGTDVAAIPSVAAAITKPPKVNVPAFTVEQVTAICAEAAAAASLILYRKSGMVYSGKCGPVTVRPVARPVNVDRRRMASGGAWGLGAWMGAASWYNLGLDGVVTHFGDSQPPEIPLPDYPIREIVEVKIDGVVIPPIEYELRDNKTIVRMRPTASYVPTERWGWPTAQINDLPDDQPGTFSITYTFGQDVDDGGRLACRRLAEILALPAFGDMSRLPARLTAISRQGVSANALNVADLISKGQLDIYEVDVWLMAVNPGQADRQSLVWSPDVARVRRTRYPTRG
jgi:hypothetical protein